MLSHSASILGCVLAAAGIGVWTLQATSENATGQGVATARPLVTADARIRIASLPYTIDECGSYLVMDCLTGIAGQHGITIDADDVTLDLGGFTLSGVPGSLDGIRATSGRTNITVRNGAVREWGEDGLDLWEATCLNVSGVQAHYNGAAGIEIGSGSTVERCLAQYNGGSTSGIGVGIRILKNVRMSNCSTGFNDDLGYLIGTANVVSDCTTESNGSHGFQLQDTNQLRGCVAMKNLGYGFKVTAVSNRLEDNLAAANAGGAYQVSSGSNFLVRNVASGFGANYDIVAGNHYGQILTSPGAGFTSDNPWANFKL